MGKGESPTPFGDQTFPFEKKFAPQPRGSEASVLPLQDYQAGVGLIAISTVLFLGNPSPTSPSKTVYRTPSFITLLSAISNYGWNFTITIAMPACQVYALI
uniref:Uncharacterized protein n=1 Tax=Cacopsylla melanoneura TaxID=428564 RepID=A0A8D8LTJ3_9HEMI